jgi:penicillin-binding protein 1A
VRQPYFVSYVKQVLISKLPGGAEQLLKGGLSIETTINRRLQFAARRAIAGVLKTPGDPAAVIVSIQPRTGAIVAMQSSTNFASLNFNLATQGARQAGSTFKAIALTAAVDDGIDPNDTYYRSTASWDCGPPLCLTPWHVETYEHTGEGTVSLANATLASDNVVYAKLSVDLGAKREVEMAHNLGITSPLKAVPSIALGSLEVTPLELTSVYATLAAGGVYRAPRAVRRVRDDDGELVGSFTEPEHRRAISDGVASVVTDILGKNMVSGTGTRARLDDGRPQAGKTGTTSDYADAWFCGYTPDLATCVWVGYPKGRITMENVEGEGVVSGPTLPAQIWHDYMTVALANVPPTEFPAPLHPADLQAFVPTKSSGPGSSSPYVAPPAPETNTATAPTGTTGGTTGTTGGTTDTTGGAQTDTTTTGN